MNRPSFVSFDALPRSYLFQPILAGLLLFGSWARPMPAAEALAASGAASEPAPGLGAVAPKEASEWGLACLSVASARETPGHPSEMGTQILLGHRIQILKQAGNWFFVRSDDGYTAWLEEGTFVRKTPRELELWNVGPLLIVTAMENTIYAAPRANSAPVSDVVMGNLLKRRGAVEGWFKVELPDGRRGYLPKAAAALYADWKKNIRPTAAHVEKTARRFIGRPYLWGGNSPKGLDCSGFAQLCFFMNGIDLPRNSRQQAQCGKRVPLENNLSALKSGDLLFFGQPATHDQPEHVVHVGIYLGEKLFIHSSERVQINSLDLASPIRDEHRIRTLLQARRVLE